MIMAWFYGINKIYNENILLFWWWIIVGIAWIISLIWILKKKRDRKYMKIQTLQQMKDMHWREFEKFISFVFTKKWFKAKVRAWRNDGGIDVDATKNWQRYAIQCKKWKNIKIWVVELRSFVGAIDVIWKNVIGIYITTSRLTPEAQIYLKKMGHKLELWDANNLEEYVRAFTGKEEIHNIQEETIKKEREILCERCGNKMVLRHAEKWSHKWENFYWCSSFPKCRNVKTI